MSTLFYVQNAVGLFIKITITEGGTALNISDCTTKQFIMRKPNGTIVALTALFDTDGVNGKLKYSWVTGDLSQSGIHEIYAIATKTTGNTYEYPTEPYKFPVYPRFVVPA